MEDFEKETAALLAWIGSAGDTSASKFPEKLRAHATIAHSLLRLTYQLTIRLELRWKQAGLSHPGRLLRWTLGTLIEQLGPRTDVTASHLLSLAQEIKGGNAKVRPSRFRASQPRPQQFSTESGLDVLFVVNVISLGGAESQLCQLAVRLKDAGMKLAILVLKPENANESAITSLLDQANIKRLKPQKTNLQDIPITMGLPPEVHKSAALVHATTSATLPKVIHSWLDHASAAAIIAGHLLQTPVIADTRSLRPTYFETRDALVLRDIYRAFGSSPQVTMCNNSLAGGADYEEWAELGTGTIHHVPNGLPEWSEGRPKRTGAGENWPKIGCLTRLSREKNLQLWVQIAAETRKDFPNAKFELYGDGPEYARLLSMVQKLKLENTVSLYPASADRQSLIESWDALLLCSKMEGLPNAAIEAISLGTPAVVNSYGGSPEVYASKHTDLIAKANKPSAYVEALKAALNQTEDDRQQAAAYVAKKFSASQQSQHYLALYERAGRANESVPEVN